VVRGAVSRVLETVRSHKQQGVSRIQRISQKRLKGSPSTSGWARSQSGTVKHIATKGIDPSARAPTDGVFTS